MKKRKEILKFYGSVALALDDAAVSLSGPAAGGSISKADTIPRFSESLRVRL